MLAPVCVCVSPACEAVAVPCSCGSQSLLLGWMRPVSGLLHCYLPKPQALTQCWDPSSSPCACRGSLPWQSHMELSPHLACNSFVHFLYAPTQHHLRAQDTPSLKTVVDWIAADSSPTCLQPVSPPSTTSVHTFPSAHERWDVMIVMTASECYDCL